MKARTCNPNRRTLQSPSRQIPARIRSLHTSKTLVRASKLQKLEADVVICGAGIIGLLTAKALLQQQLSVILVERKQLCAGATGAGQGYIWMAHRSPDTVGWELAAASTALWQDLTQQDMAFRHSVEWQDTGSLLLASTADEAALLEQRSHTVTRHGIEAQLLTADQVMKLEPAVKLNNQGAGLLVQSDAQINGRQTAAALLEQCRQHGGKLQVLMDEPVQQLICHQGRHEHQQQSKVSSMSQAGAVVQTGQHELAGRLATVIAAGAWSGQLLAAATGHDIWNHVFVPRRGHLLEIKPPAGMPPLKTGMMEMSYTKHYTPHGMQASHSSQGSGHAGSHAAAADITFTATTSLTGSLLVGSSREDGQFDTQSNKEVVAAIMARASQFLPNLARCEMPSGPAVRVGPRPFAVGGLPLIGPVPNQPGLFIAAGHEGSGLCLGPATAQLLVTHILSQAGIPHNPMQGVLSERPNAVLHSLQQLHTWHQLLPEERLLVVAGHV